MKFNDKQEEEIFYRVKQLMNWDDLKCRAWLNTPNPHFGDATPFKMICLGQGHKVINFIKMCGN